MFVDCCVMLICFETSVQLTQGMQGQFTVNESSTRNKRGIQPQ